MKNLVLYDGQCGLCDRTVQWLLKIDRRRVLTFAPLQGETAKTLSLPQSSSETLQTIIFISDFKTPQQMILYKSDAVLEILKCVGGLWGFSRRDAFGMRLLRMTPKGVRDSVYDWIARNRYAWFGKYESCKIPSPETRSRFLP